eukprot:SM000273S10245  [mRNA]  locus=s273:65016:69533:- [translate_table: standard]
MAGAGGGGGLWDDAALVAAFDTAVRKYQDMHGLDPTTDPEAGEEAPALQQPSPAASMAPAPEDDAVAAPSEECDSVAHNIDASVISEPPAADAAPAMAAGELGGVAADAWHGDGSAEAWQPAGGACVGWHAPGCPAAHVCAAWQQAGLAWQWVAAPQPQYDGALEEAAGAAAAAAEAWPPAAATDGTTAVPAAAWDCAWPAPHHCHATGQAARWPPSALRHQCHCCHGCSSETAQLSAWHCQHSCHHHRTWPASKPHLPPPTPFPAHPSAPEGLQPAPPGNQAQSLVRTSGTGRLDAAGVDHAESVVEVNMEDSAGGGTAEQPPAPVAAAGPFAGEGPELAHGSEPDDLRAVLEAWYTAGYLTARFAAIFLMTGCLPKPLLLRSFASDQEYMKGTARQSPGTGEGWHNAACESKALFGFSDYSSTNPELGCRLQAARRRHGCARARAAARRRRLAVSARGATGGAVKQIEVDVDKPLGLNLAQRDKGGVIITGVQGGSNGAKAGLKAGDQIVYCSSFFGDELWPADRLGFLRTCINARPDFVTLVVARGGEERATHICLDCGYIYTQAKPFDEQPDGFVCPQCSAPKRRFALYDAETGQSKGGSTPIAVIAGVMLGAAGIAAAVFYGLQ